MNALQISNLSKTYGNGTKAIDDITLEIKNGMFGLLGANGAGKSSLMRTIASLQEPSRGSIRFNDVDIVNTPQYVRERLGYLPQEFGVYPKMSAEKLLHHIAVLKGIHNAKQRKQQIEDLLHQTNLYVHRKKAVATFSGGMRQRFGIAQALLGNPQLVIVDEPTAGLDPEERNRFLNLLSEIGESVIVILSTHIVEDVRNLCENLAILSQGKILVQGNPAALVESIQGKIWSKIIAKKDLEIYKTSFQFISSTLVGGQTEVKVYSEFQPEEGFTAVQADLEDYYFTTLAAH